MGELENTQLFNEIYEKTNKSTLIYITSKCKKAEDISDIFQETYMELYKVISTKGTAYINTPEAFIHRIAKQKIYRHYSVFERLKLQIPFSSAADDESPVGIESFTDESVTIEDDLLFDESVGEVKEILKTKPEDVQKIFYLFYSLDLKISEIAKNMSLSESNVKNKLYRTLREIRETLEKKEAVLK